MKTRLAKELSALLPAWVAAMGLAVAPVAIFDVLRSPLWLALFGLGAALLGVETFGREFSCGTFNLLLSQPIPRHRIWAEKMLALALTSGVAWLALRVAVSWKLAGQPSQTNFEQLAAASALALACGAGGLAMTLLFRQAAAGFWFAILLPGALLTLGNAARERFFPENHWILWGLLAGYSALMLAGARIGFGRMQDVQWLAREIALPKRLGMVGRGASRAPRRRGTTAALLWKEVHLQQINFAAAGLLALLLVTLVAFRKATGAGPAESWGAAETGILWILFFMPALVGAVAIAEERKLGLHVAQLSLPIAPRTQIRAKFAAVYGVSFLLGIALPLLLISLAGWLLPDQRQAIFEPFRALGQLAAVWLCATAFGLFASSLSGSFLQALSSLGLLVVAGFIIDAIAAWRFSRWPVPSPFALFNLFELLAVFLFSLILAAKNFRLEIVTVSDLGRNARALAAGFLAAAGVGAAVYGRVWENFLPAPKARPHVVLSGSVRPVVVMGGVRACVSAILAPDGRLFESLQWTDPRSEPFLIDSHRWLDFSGALGVRGDGTLWSWTDPSFFVTQAKQRAKYRPPALWGMAPPTAAGGIKRKATATTAREKAQSPIYNGPFPVQIGREKDWKAAAGTSHGLALKTDGTLWAWGDNRFGQLGDGTREPRAFPVQIGTDTWSSVAARYLKSAGVKTDGSLWIWGEAVARHAFVDRPLRVGAETNWERVLDVWSICLALKKDGTLWMWEPLSQTTRRGLSSAGTPTQLGAGQRWRTAAVGLSGILAIRADGALWRWRDGAKAEQVGIRRDWLAVAGAGSTDFGLTADGGLWAWGGYWGKCSALSDLIPPSQRPHRIIILPSP